jgi:two-component system nitrate/nitrite response regulator NarL
MGARDGRKAVDAVPAPEATIAPNSARLRLAIVWGVRFTRESLAETLGRDPAVSVVGLYGDLAEALPASDVQPDIVLIDARIPEGAAAVRRALEAAPGMRIVAAAVREVEDDIIAWAEAGVIGYIPRNTPLTDFVSALMDIHRGEQACSRQVAAGLLRRIALTARPAAGRDRPLPRARLTKRERQAAELIRAGLSDKEIARQLNISLATTKSHVHSLLGKLQLRRRSEVADYLREYAATSP